MPLAACLSPDLQPDSRGLELMDTYSDYSIMTKNTIHNGLYNKYHVCIYMYINDIYIYICMYILTVYIHIYVYINYICMYISYVYIYIYIGLKQKMV